MNRAEVAQIFWREEFIQEECYSGNSLGKMENCKEGVLRDKL